VTVVPLCVPAPVSPHATTQSGPTQFLTVQLFPGQVTWQSGVPAQSTLHLAEALHSTWQVSPFAQPTLHGSPGLHWTSHGPPPTTQSVEHGELAAHTHSLPRQTSLVEQPNARAITKTKLFMWTFRRTCSGIRGCRRRDRHHTGITRA
jgi:hypothetical protein